MELLILQIFFTSNPKRARIILILSFKLYAYEVIKGLRCTAGRVGSFENVSPMTMRKNSLAQLDYSIPNTTIFILLERFCER